MAAAVEGSWRLQLQRGGRTAGQHWRAAGSQRQHFHSAGAADELGAGLQPGWVECVQSAAALDHQSLRKF